MTMRTCFLVVLMGVLPWQRAWSSELLLGVNVYSFDYKESLSEPLKSTEKATVTTLTLGEKVPITGWGRSYLNLEAEASPSTKSHFDGTTQSGTPVTDTDELSFFRGEADLSIQAADNFFFYTGVGWRYWNRFLNGGSGYREIYTWGYWPVGFRWELPSPSAQLTWALDASYRMMWGGQIKVIFSETVINGDDTTLTLGNRPGYKLQMPFRFALSSNRIAVLVSPWWESSEIGESDVKYNATMASYIQEPSSRTTQMGVASAFAFSF